MTALAVVLCLLLGLASVLLLFVKHHFSYWTRRGIPHDVPSLRMGNMSGFRSARPLRAIVKDYYDKYKGTGPFAGFYYFFVPSVLLLDLDLIKNVLIRDFHNFPERGMFYNEKDDPLSAHILALDGEKWKTIRHKLSPTFSSGKIRLMFPTVMSVGDQLLETLNGTLAKDLVVEVHDILARFTVDVIGSCAFGIDCNSLKDPNAEFHVMGKKAFALSRHSQAVESLLFSYPKLARKLRMRQIHEDVHRFFLGAVRETVEYRERNSVRRNDFMNLLIETRNSADGMSIEEIAAQAFIFFLAGFEATSTTMGCALFELAVNQDVQDKLRAEVDEQFTKHGGRFVYESIAAMHYMDRVFKETLRKYSAISLIIRKSLHDYPTADPKYTIPKGATVLIPSDAIHRDPGIYPDPERFDPERFAPEEILKRHPITWLPFGDGPRNCIALRFARMQTFIGLTLLVRNFRFTPCERTLNPLEMSVKNALLEVEGGIHLRVERIRGAN